jgi:hypothetical protein
MYGTKMIVQSNNEEAYIEGVSHKKESKEYVATEIKEAERDEKNSKWIMTQILELRDSEIGQYNEGNSKLVKLLKEL